MLRALTRSALNIASLTSSKLVITAGLLFESVKLDTGVLSPSLPALEAAATTVVGVVKETDVATVLVFEPAVTAEAGVDETEVATTLVLEAAVTVVVGVSGMEVATVLVLEVTATVVAE